MYNNVKYIRSPIFSVYLLKIDGNTLLMKIIKNFELLTTVQHLILNYANNENKRKFGRQVLHALLSNQSCFYLFCI